MADESKSKSKADEARAAEDAQASAEAGVVAPATGQPTVGAEVPVGSEPLAEAAPAAAWPPVPGAPPVAEDAPLWHRQLAAHAAWVRLTEGQNVTLTPTGVRVQNVGPERSARLAGLLNAVFPAWGHHAEVNAVGGQVVARVLKGA